MRKVLNKWKEKLLDTGKGNNLINFKFSSGKNLEIIYPSENDVIKLLTANKAISFFDIDKTFEEFEQEYTISYSEKLNLLKSLITNGKVKIKKDTIIGTCQKNTCLASLGKLYKTNTNFLQEKGINILYLAYTFLKWEDTTEKQIFTSPVLLLPISITKDKLNKSYIIQSYEDEIITNPTLLYKLQNEYKLNLPIFRDENFESEDLNSYLIRLQQFANTNNWQVDEKCYISCFSFLKINMYKDLNDNEEKVISNPLIQRLANKCDEYNFNEYENQNIETPLHNVVDADTSQLEAIKRAMQGESFVLQGPPGTGKSQTITNLIAEFLYNGKKVLFVSEKLAALKVVYNNLEKANLANFCLELHSNKTNKKEVVSSLYKELSSEKFATSHEAESHTQKLALSKQKLDDFSNIIQTPIKQIQKSPYEIFNLLSELKNIPNVEYLIENIENKNFENLTQVLHLIEEYIQYSETIGYNYKTNKFYGLNLLNLNYSEKINFKKLLEKNIQLFNLILNNQQKINSLLKLDFKNLNEINSQLHLLKFISKMQYFDSAFFDKQKLPAIINLIKEFNIINKNTNLQKNKLLEKYSRELFNLNINELYLKFNNEYKSCFRIFNSAYRKDIKTIKLLGNNKKIKYSYNSVLADLKICNTISNNQQILKQKQQQIADYLNEDCKTILNNLNNIETELLHLENAIEINYLSTINGDEFKNIQSELALILKTFDTLNFETIDNLQTYFNNNIFNLEKNEINSILIKLNNIINNYDNLENYIKFNNLLLSLQNNNLIDFINLLINNNYEIKDFTKIYEKAFYNQFIFDYISKNEILNNFTLEKQQALVETFIQEEQISFEISKAKIIEKLGENKPTNLSLSNHGQVAILMREAHKKSHLKPVHKLLSEINELVQILKPCFLMSPLSVSTYLQNNSCEFDVVIFDEASQIFPWDAIGAIYRAKQVIIVGDSKQMPPTNFFNANVFNDEIETDDENSETLDFESILDLALSTFNTISLKWHYRSKTEELIAFSNKYFYDGNLVTFPTANKSSDLGIDFTYVENGVYNRKTNQNQIEAEKIVELVFEHFKAHPERSLGVVAFSISQQNIIEELISKKRAQNKKFEKYFDSNLEEPFFIKNLETVQGDERDTIIFSVAYGKDENGKFIHNFGPLNKQGGERRLNVAITRAKYNVKLVASIKSHDIDLNKTEMRGSMLLKEYLNYAENNGKNIQIVYEKNSNIQSIQNEVKEILEQNGYIVDYNLGTSSFKIPLAIKKPNSNDYFMAIDFERQLKHTRERERLRKQNCERMGWTYYKIYALDWFTNKKMATKKLLKVLEEKTQNSSKEKTTKQYNFLVKSNLNIKTEIDQKYVNMFNNYNYFNANEYCLKHNKALTFDNIIEPLIEQEQPITEKFLLKRLTQVFPGERITDNFVHGFYCAINEHKNILRHNDYYCLNKNISTNLRTPSNQQERRALEDISIYELADGLKTIIEECVGIDKTGLYKTAIKLLGYYSLSPKMENVLNKAIDLLITNKTIYLQDNQYFV